MARQCRGVTAAGNTCRRPPSRDSSYCLAHDPTRTADHAAVSASGGKARWSENVEALKADVRLIMRRVDDGELDTDRARTLLAAHRILRDYEGDARQAAMLDDLHDEIQDLRDTLGAA